MQPCTVRLPTIGPIHFIPPYVEMSSQDHIDDVPAKRIRSVTQLPHMRVNRYPPRSERHPVLRLLLRRRVDLRPVDLRRVDLSPVDLRRPAPDAARAPPCRPPPCRPPPCRRPPCRPPPPRARCCACSAVSTSALSTSAVSFVDTFRVRRRPGPARRCRHFPCPPPHRSHLQSNVLFGRTLWGE